MTLWLHQTTCHHCARWSHWWKWPAGLHVRHTHQDTLSAQVRWQKVLEQFGSEAEGRKQVGSAEFGWQGCTLDPNPNVSSGGPSWYSTLGQGRWSLCHPMPDPHPLCCLAPLHFGAVSVKGQASRSNTGPVASFCQRWANLHATRLCASSALPPGQMIPPNQYVGTTLNVSIFSAHFLSLYLGQ